MHHSVATYGKLLLIIGVAGYLAGGETHWMALGPAAFGVVALAMTCGPLRTPSAAVAGITGTLIAVLSLSRSAAGLADMPAAIGGDPAVDGLMTLSRSLTSLVSLAVLLALAAQWLLGDREAGA